MRLSIMLLNNNTSTSKNYKMKAYSPTIKVHALKNYKIHLLRIKTLKMQFKGTLLLIKTKSLFSIKNFK